MNDSDSDWKSVRLGKLKNVRKRYLRIKIRMGGFLVVLKKPCDLCFGSSLSEYDSQNRGQQAFHFILAARNDPIESRKSE